MNTHSTSLPKTFLAPSPLEFDPRTIHWSYRFQDGSFLQGKIIPKTEPDTSPWNNQQQIEADYWSQDGKTCLLHWDNSHFACFDLINQGEELLIIASSDNFVGNSMCLVYSPIRSCVQVTDQGHQWVKETFNPSAWVFQTEQKYQTATYRDIELDLTVFPLFPFFSVRLSWKEQYSQKNYQWTYFPYFSLIPRLQISPIATTS